MSRFKMTPEEMKIIRWLRKCAAHLGVSVEEYIEDLETAAFSEDLDKDLSDWSVGEKGEIIITEDTGK